MTVEDTTSRPADATAAALLVLEKLGVSVSDLQLTENPVTRVVPTFSEYAPQVAAATKPHSRQIWIHYWNFLVEEWGDRRIDEPRASDLDEMANRVQQRALRRKGSKDGLGAKSNFVDATKSLYQHAVKDKYIDAVSNPAAELKRPGPPNRTGERSTQRN